MNTLLDASLRQYRKLFGEKKGKALASFAQLVGQVLGKVPRESELRYKALKAVEEWDYPRKEAVLFGLEAVQLLKKEGSIGSGWSSTNISGKAIESLHQAYCTALGMKELREDMKGVGDAAWLSYAIGISPEQTAEFQASNEHDVKIAGLLSAMAYIKAGVEPTFYNDTYEYAVKRVAATIESALSSRSAFSPWSELFEKQEDNGEDGGEDGGEGDGTDGDGDKQEESRLTPEQMQSLADQLLDTAKDKTRGTFVPRVRDNIEPYIEHPNEFRPLPTSFTSSPPLGEAIVRESGYYTGIPTQLWRIATDQKVGSKRVRRSDLPDAVFGIGLDASGSMGRIFDKAVQVHDEICYSLGALGISYVNCAYTGSDRKAKPDDIYPLHGGSGEDAIEYGTGGNGDLGAVTWLTKQISRAQANVNVVIMIADGHFTNVTVEKMREELDALRTVVIHVDYSGSNKNPFSTPYRVKPEGAQEAVFKIISEILRI